MSVTNPLIRLSLYHVTVISNIISCVPRFIALYSHFPTHHYFLWWRMACSAYYYHHPHLCGLILWVPNTSVSFRKKICNKKWTRLRTSTMVVLLVSCIFFTSVTLPCCVALSYILLLLPEKPRLVMLTCERVRLLCPSCTGSIFHWTR